MMNKRKLNGLRFFALAASACSLLILGSCKDDEKCDEVQLYADVDADGLGDINAAGSVCADADGYVTNNYDNNDSEDFSSGSIMDLIEDVEALDSLEKYLKNYPDLTAMLSASGSYTVFLPTNAAFAGLLETPGFPQDIASINADIIKNVLAYHVVASKTMAADLTSGTSVATLSQGNEAIIVNSDGTLKTGSSTSNIVIEVTDLATTNAVGHIVSSVLIPPSVGDQLTPLLETNGGTLMLGASFSILADAIRKADTFAVANSLPTLLSVISGEANHTVFAPTNGTFEAGSITLETYTGQQWYGIISNHVVMQDVLPTSLTTGATFSTLYSGDGGTTYNELLIFNNTESVPAKNGVGIYIDSNNDVDLQTPSTLENLDAEIALPNAAVNSNGRVHVIAGVLAPPAASGN